MVGNVRPALMLLLGAVGFVLLIARANVANLLHVRGQRLNRAPDRQTHAPLLRRRGPGYTIVGIIGDVKQGGIAEETGTELYRFHPQLGHVGANTARTMNVVVRTARWPIALASDVRRVVREADASLPVANLATMDEVLHASMARPRFITLLLGIFAGVGLALAAIGTYGVMTYSVAQRRQEIGIRMALGARAGNVLGMVLAQGAGVAVVGLVVGIAGAFVLTRLLSSLLFDVGVTDAVAFLSGPLVLAAVALLACWIPAQRAARTDPASVLKQD